MLGLNNPPMPGTSQAIYGANTPAGQAQQNLLNQQHYLQLMATQFPQIFGGQQPKPTVDIPSLISQYLPIAQQSVLGMTGGMDLPYGDDSSLAAIRNVQNYSQLVNNFLWQMIGANLGQLENQQSQYPQLMSQLIGGMPQWGQGQYGGYGHGGYGGYGDSVQYLGNIIPGYGFGVPKPTKPQTTQTTQRPIQSWTEPEEISQYTEQGLNYPEYRYPGEKRKTKTMPRKTRWF